MLIMLSSGLLWSGLLWSEGRAFLHALLTRGDDPRDLPGVPIHIELHALPHVAGEADGFPRPADRTPLAPSWARAALPLAALPLLT
jgi:hypothetical protein